MSKLPRVTSIDTIRALERLGFVQVSQKGSLVKMRRDTHVCVVPFHKKSLAVGTLHGILKQNELPANPRPSGASHLQSMDRNFMPMWLMTMATETN